MQCMHAPQRLSVLKLSLMDSMQCMHAPQRLSVLMLAADFWDDWRVSSAVASCGDGCDEEKYWEDPESGSGMDDWESGGPDQARPKRITEARRRWVCTCTVA